VNNASSFVRVGPGEFRESVTINTAGLTLEGSGERTLIDGEQSGDAIKVSASDVTIQNLSAQTSNGGDIAINIPVESDTGASVLNVLIPESGDEGINIRGNGGLIAGTTIENVAQRGIFCNKNLSTLAGGDRVIVTNCIISDCGSSAILTQGGENVISNCICRGTGSHGIVNSGNDAIVIGNRIDNTVNNGIDNSNNDTILANNRISNTGGSGIFDDGTGNVLDANLIT
jgi:hypothetical protein